MPTALLIHDEKGGIGKPVVFHSSLILKGLIKSYIRVYTSCVALFAGCLASVQFLQIDLLLQISANSDKNFEKILFINRSFIVMKRNFRM